MAKDNFSEQAKTYATFRPSYPQSVYDFIFSLVKNHELAWDCGTGNGQMARELAQKFRLVEATDLSQKQIDNAYYLPNICYSVSMAETTNFPSNSFDLITVAQAIHWFNFEQFYSEVHRVAKNGAILFVIGYSMPHFEGEIEVILQNFYWNVVGKYWDSERKMIDDHYQSIPFPFEEIIAPNFFNEYSWTLNQLEGYLNTWSAVQHYIKQNHKNPVENVIDELKTIWNEHQKVVFPMFTRVGLIRKKIRKFSQSNNVTLFLNLGLNFGVLLYINKF